VLGKGSVMLAGGREDVGGADGGVVYVESRRGGGIVLYGIAYMSSCKVKNLVR